MTKTCTCISPEVGHESILGYFCTTCDGIIAKKQILRWVVRAVKMQSDRVFELTTALQARAALAQAKE